MNATRCPGITTVPLFNSQWGSPIRMVPDENHEELTSDNRPLATDETEPLLDIDGLLEIARFINILKKEGRIGDADEERLGH